LKTARSTLQKTAGRK